MTNRQQQAMATRQKIFDTAEQMVNERNDYDISVDEIMARCGMAKGTFYHYFKTKDELLVALTQKFYQQIRQKYLDSEGKASCLTRLRGFLSDWYAQATRFHAPFSFISREFYTNVGKYHGSDSQVRPLENGLEIIQECLRGAVDSAELRPDTPVNQLALLIIFSMHGSCLHQSKYDEGFDLHQWAENFGDIVFDLMLKSYLL